MLPYVSFAFQLDSSSNDSTDFCEKSNQMLGPGKRCSKNSVRRVKRQKKGQRATVQASASHPVELARLSCGCIRWEELMAFTAWGRSFLSATFCPGLGQIGGKGGGSDLKASSSSSAIPTDAYSTGCMGCWHKVLDPPHGWQVSQGRLNRCCWESYWQSTLDPISWCHLMQTSCPKSCSAH